MQLGFVYTLNYQNICFPVAKVYGSEVCMVTGFKAIGISFFQ
jgi:hypothetical protein